MSFVEEKLIIKRHQLHIKIEQYKYLFEIHVMSSEYVFMNLGCVQKTKAYNSPLIKKYILNRANSVSLNVKIIIKDNNIIYSFKRYHTIILSLNHIMIKK